MNRYRAPRSQLIELVIPATLIGNNQQVKFQSQPQLQTILGEKRVWLQAIEIISADSMPFSPLTTGMPVATAADIQNGSLCLISDNELRYNLIPLAILSRIQSIGFTPFIQDLFEFQNAWRISWTTSYVLINVQPPVRPFSYLFNVYYDYRPRAEDLIDGQVVEA